MVLALIYKPAEMLRRQRGFSCPLPSRRSAPIPSFPSRRPASRQTSSPTVQEVAEQWLAERIDHTHRKADQVRGYVDRAIIPELGSTRVRDIEPSDIARVIRAYRDRVARLPRARTGGRPAARALLAVFKGLFGYAVANGWIAQSQRRS
jgi:predicted RNA-binding Zn ribbon-like protein